MTTLNEIFLTRYTEKTQCANAKFFLRIFHPATARIILNHMAPFACVIVTYLPDDACLDNLIKMAEMSDLLIIIDNSPLPFQPKLPHLPNTKLVCNGENIGLASALNKGIKIAGDRGFENIFLFDQDSKIPPSYFARMIDFKHHIDTHTNRCALYVPDVYDRNSGTYARFPVIKKYAFRHRTAANSPRSLLCKGIIAITSGSLLPYSKYLAVGPLPDDYFIDFIDNEYCLRIARKDYLVAVNFEVALNHAIGRRVSKKLFNLTIKTNNHPPQRRYYIARNGIATALRYFSTFPSFFALVFLRLLHEILTILLYEDGVLKKLIAMLHGFGDVLGGRMGHYKKYP